VGRGFFDEIEPRGQPQRANARKVAKFEGGSEPATEPLTS
jgi:hypothetical protein